MLCSRCLLPVLALYLLLEVISAAALLGKHRNKRELSWFEQEVFQRLLDAADHGDLSVGDAARPARPVAEATEHVARQQQQQQHQRKSNERRRKVAPLDPIGRFQMSSHRTQKDEPDGY